MPRTNTTTDPTISFPSSGTLTFPVPASPRSRTSYALPPNSKFDTDLHWHEQYTEYFCISSGVMRLTLESPSGELITSYIGPGSKIIEVPIGRRHRLRRGDEGDGWKDWMEDVEWREGGKIERSVWEQEVRGEEWTGPADGRKEAFFRNLAGVVGEEKAGGWWVWEEALVTVGVFAVMRRFDNWPAFFGNGSTGRVRRMRGGRWLEWLVSHVVLAVVSWIGMVMGIRGEYEEYTPKELRVARREGKKGV